MKIINSGNILSFLSDHLPAKPLIIEAGSFNGTDTKKMSLFWPDSTIHAFEPVPEIFKQLLKETVSYPNISCYPLALSNRTGPALFYVAQHPKKPGAPCQAGSLHKPKDRLKESIITYPSTIEVETISLWQWAKIHNISHADLIWLDMQGHELAVLKESVEFIRKATLIYVEVNFIAAYDLQPTPDEIDQWLEKQGFIAIARDFNQKPHHFFGNVVYKRKI